jgi:hypothetical protein
MKIKAFTFINPFPATLYDNFLLHFFLDHSLCHRGPFSGQRMPSKWNQEGKIWNQSVLRIHEVQGHKLQPPVNSNGESRSAIHSLSCYPIRYPACCRSTIIRSSTNAVPTPSTQLQLPRGQFPRTTQCLLNMHSFFSDSYSQQVLPSK